MFKKWTMRFSTVDTTSYARTVDALTVGKGCKVDNVNLLLIYTAELHSAVQFTE